MTLDRERFELLLPFYVNGTLSAEDKAFVDAYLAEHEQARESLAWTSSIQQTVQCVANSPPDEQRVAQFLLKLTADQATVNQSPKAQHLQLPSVRRQGWWFLTGMAMAALAASLVLTPGLFPAGVLHWDQLDGRPDLQLTLADNLKPSDPLVVAYLEQHGAQVLEQTEADGHYLIKIDLKNRAHDQHRLIRAMIDQGQLESYTLLASR
jgi:predicted nucleic acid-binding protein